MLEVLLAVMRLCELYLRDVEHSYIFVLCSHQAISHKIFTSLSIKHKASTVNASDENHIFHKT